ncbi:MAG: MlaD family protein [Planctomycetota bacterium]
MNPKRDFLVGLTAIVGIFGLIGMLTIFGELSGAGRNSYPITVGMPDARGLGQGSSVRLSGIRIGKVAKAVAAEDPTKGVIVTLKIDEGVRVPRNVVVTISSDFIGDTIMSMAVPSDEPVPGYLAAGDRIDVVPLGLFDQIGQEVLGELDQRLEPIVGAAESVQTLADTYNRVGEELLVLVEPRTTTSVDSGDQVANLSTMIQRLDTAVANANEWIADPDRRGRVDTILENVAGLSDEAAGTLERWTALAESLDVRAGELAGAGEQAVARFIEATDQLSVATEEVQVIAARINEGEGTVGQLVTNPDLYQSLDDAAKRLDAALIEAQLLMQKWKAEGLPIRL